MRKFITIVLFLAICTISVAEVNLNEINFPTVNARTFDRSLRGWIGTLNTDITNSGINRGTGRIFYVDNGAGGSSSSTGKSPVSAVPTLNDGVNLCTANRGDVIYVMQNHTENLTGADAVDIDVKGVTVIGLGNGNDRPSFFYDDGAAEFVIGASSVRITNLTFIPSITTVVHAIDIENAGDWAIIDNCEFLLGVAVNTDEFIDVIQVGTTATDVIIAYNKMVHTTSSNETNTFVDLSAATISNPSVIGNYVYGNFQEALISGGAAVPTECVIVGNILTNLDSGEEAIEFAGNATGVCANNILQTSAINTALDSGLMSDHGNTWSSPTADVEAVPVHGQVGLLDHVNNLIGVDDSSNLGVTTNVTADSDGSVLERLEQIDVDTSAAVLDTAEIQQTNGVRTISKSLGTIASGANNIFAVAGGAIKVTEWTIYIDTIMVATGCLIGGNVDPTVPATDTVFGTTGTALEFNGMAAGSLVMWNGVLANNFTATTNGVALSTNTAEGMIVPIGMIELTASASNAGALTVYMSYIALGEGVTVTAQ